MHSWNLGTCIPFRHIPVYLAACQPQLQHLSLITDASYPLRTQTPLGPRGMVETLTQLRSLTRLEVGTESHSALLVQLLRGSRLNLTKISIGFSDQLTWTFGAGHLVPRLASGNTDHPGTPDRVFYFPKLEHLALTCAFFSGGICQLISAFNIRTSRSLNFGYAVALPLPSALSSTVNLSLAYHLSRSLNSSIFKTMKRIS